MSRRILMWLEFAIGAALGLLALFFLGIFVFQGQQDPRHGGLYFLLGGGLLAIGSAGFLVAAAGLRGASRVGWLGQIFPAGVVGWLLWDILSHWLRR